MSTLELRAVTTAPTRYIILTQSHTDHIGGVDTFREDGTQLIAQASIGICQADDERIQRVAHPALVRDGGHLRAIFARDPRRGDDCADRCSVGRGNVGAACPDADSS